MPWFLTHDVDDLFAEAGEWLRARPVENTLGLTIAESVRRDGPGAFGGTRPRFGWYRPDGAVPDGGGVAAAFVHTPPRAVVLCGDGSSATDLARALAHDGWPVLGFNGPADAAEDFARQWVDRTGTTAEERRRSRLYRLAQLAPPDPAPPGRSRPGGPDDRDLLLEWYDAFFADMGEAGDPGLLVDSRLGHAGVTIWEVDGEPVSTAAHTRPIAGMVRIGPVYTPVDRRRHGYGAAATAAATRAALDAGNTEVVLFTDLANPISNSIYQRIGYRPVHDLVQLAFA